VEITQSINNKLPLNL